MNYENLVVEKQGGVATVTINRPAVGFSLDLKELVTVLPPRPLKAAIRAPWGEDVGLSAVIREVRANGETVVCVLPGHEHEVNEFDCDRQLVSSQGQWHVQAFTPVVAAVNQPSALIQTAG